VLRSISRAQVHTPATPIGHGADESWQKVAVRRFESKGASL
jgi:hypothetical protein